MKKARYLIGVDEVGRGPLAGPVTVGAVIIPSDFKFPEMKLSDSKKLSLKQREEWFLYIKEHSEIFYTTASVSPAVIDRIGISKATIMAVERSIKKLSPTWTLDVQVKVLLDGLLHAPEQYRQKTIIKGDEKIPVISLASIVAKVTRDRKMVGFAKKFPEYGFESHKGYGTQKHYERIEKHGVTDIHRRSFLSRVDIL